MKVILLYHIYPINNWKVITEKLFQKLPFDAIVVHVSLPLPEDNIKLEIEKFFNRYPISQYLYTPNSGTGEVDALKSLVENISLVDYDILTYMHCKGVTRQNNPHIDEWREIMRYFVVDRMDICQKVFKKGYITYGINKTAVRENHDGFRGSNFFYEGNFVSVNLKLINLKTEIENKLEPVYYGVEGFWGKLCEWNLGYSAFQSEVNHYLSYVSEKNYKTKAGRWIYSIRKKYYKLKKRISL